MPSWPAVVLESRIPNMEETLAAWAGRVAPQVAVAIEEGGRRLTPSTP